MNQERAVSPDRKEENQSYLLKAEEKNYNQLQGKKRINSIKVDNIILTC